MQPPKRSLTKRDREKQLLEELEKLVFFGSVLGIVGLVILYIYLDGLLQQNEKPSIQILELCKSLITNLISVPFLFVLSYMTYRRIHSITTQVNNETLSEVIAEAVVKKLSNPNNNIEIPQISKIQDTLSGIQETLSPLDINEIALSLENKRYGGVKCVLNHLYIQDLEREFSESKNIVIMNTWIPNLSDLSVSLITAINNGCKTRIMILYPNSGISALRSEALGDTTDGVKTSILNCLNDLRGIHNKIRPENRDGLKIRVFNSLPSISVYGTDKHYFVSFFMHEKLAIRSPQMKVTSQNSLLGQSVGKEIDTIWGIGKEFRDINEWRTELERMAREFTIQ